MLGSAFSFIELRGRVLEVLHLLTGRLLKHRKLLFKSVVLETEGRSYWQRLILLESAVVLFLLM